MVKAVHTTKIMHARANVKGISRHMVSKLYVLYNFHLSRKEKYVATMIFFLFRPNLARGPSSFRHFRGVGSSENTFCLYFINIQRNILDTVTIIFLGSK